MNSIKQEKIKHMIKNIEGLFYKNYKVFDWYSLEEIKPIEDNILIVYKFTTKHKIDLYDLGMHDLKFLAKNRAIVISFVGNNSYLCKGLNDTLGLTINDMCDFKKDFNINSQI